MIVTERKSSVFLWQSSSSHFLLQPDRTTCAGSGGSPELHRDTDSAGFTVRVFICFTRCYVLLLFHTTSENHILTEDRDKIETCQRKAGFGSADSPHHIIVRPNWAELNHMNRSCSIPTPSPGIGIHGVDSKSRFWSNIFWFTCVIVSNYYI